jgi:short-subunit dehydrogenase
LEPSAQKIRKETGQHVETVTLDATDFSAVQQFSERFGPAASIVHYNAAAIQKTDALETPVETMQRNLSVDILGAARCDQVLRALRGGAAQRNHSAH